MSLLEAEDLHKSFGDVRALDGASLIVRGDEAVVLRGPSGSGKSTLLRVLAGLEAPDRGHLRIDGQPPHAPLHARGIGLVFQSPALWPHLTVSENVTFGLHALPAADQRARAATLLARLDLQHVADRRPSGLSGGEARRVAVARALAPRPRWLLLDEPLAHLDDAGIDDLVGLLGEALGEGTGLLVVTHAPFEAPWVARTLRMERGRIM